MEDLRGKCTPSGPSSGVTAASPQTEQDEIKLWELMKCDGVLQNMTPNIYISWIHTDEAVMKGWWVCMNQAGLDKHGLVQMGAGLGISSKTVLQLQTGPVRTLPQGSAPSQCSAASSSQVSGAGPSSRCTRGEGRWCQVGLGWKEGCETLVGMSLPARWSTDRVSCSRREKAGHRCCSWGGQVGPGRTAAHQG